MSEVQIIDRRNIQLKLDHVLKHQEAQACYLKADTMEHQGIVKVRTKEIRKIVVI